MSELPSGFAPYVVTSKDPDWASTMHPMNRHAEKNMMPNVLSIFFAFSQVFVLALFELSMHKKILIVSTYNSGEEFSTIRVPTNI